MSRIGIIGGGQLAAMLVEACNAANASENSVHRVLVLDADPKCPATLVGGTHIMGKPATGEGYDSLAAVSDVLTIDVENVSVEDLSTLQTAGHTVVPAPALLQRITDKLEQKRWYTELGLPTAEFIPHPAEQEITSEPFGFPVVQKAARGGYDGRGVCVLRSLADNADRLPVSGFLERYIERRMEISVMVAADGHGEVVSYQPVEMVFHEGGNVLDYLVAPARLEADPLTRAQELAVTAIKAMEGQGIFGVEMFLTEAGALLINEISPRTHNSGHYTMEACRTSQFTQQLNIVTGRPLGSTEQLNPAVMFNLLGADGFKGDTVVEGAAEVSSDTDVSVHLYGKSHCFPGRKMGHVTVVADTVDAALKKMDHIRPQIQVRGANPID
jgi:5-(carboxyamino)imidazole ribonucleotide synthase